MQVVEKIHFAKKTSVDKQSNESIMSKITVVVTGTLLGYEKNKYYFLQNSIESKVKNKVSPHPGRIPQIKM